MNKTEVYSDISGNLCDITVDVWKIAFSALHKRDMILRNSLYLDIIRMLVLKPIKVMNILGIVCHC